MKYILASLLLLCVFCGYAHSDEPEIINWNSTDSWEAREEFILYTEAMINANSSQAMEYYYKNINATPSTVKDYVSWYQRNRAPVFLFLFGLLILFVGIFIGGIIKGKKKE